MCTKFASKIRGIVKNNYLQHAYHIWPDEGTLSYKHTGYIMGCLHQAPR